MASDQQNSLVKAIDNSKSPLAPSNPQHGANIIGAAIEKRKNIIGSRVVATAERGLAFIAEQEEIIRAVQWKIEQTRKHLEAIEAGAFTVNTNNGDLIFHDEELQRVRFI